MKNIQVIDDALNCTYSIYEVDDASFSLLFPGKDQNIAFIEDIVSAHGDEMAGKLVIKSTKTLVKKEIINGLHGTLFIGKSHMMAYYPNRREDDLDSARAVL